VAANSANSAVGHSFRHQLVLADSIGIVGTGAVAQALGRALHAGGAPVTAVSGRSLEKASHVADSIGPVVRAVPLADLPRFADHIIITTSDGAVYEIARLLAAAGLARGVAVHTCGGCAPDVLEPLRIAGVACGVFHPLQTIVPDADPLRLFRGITCVTVGDTPAIAWGAELAVYLEAAVVSIAPGALASYHAGAVLASNAVIALVDAAAGQLQAAGVEPAAALRALEPLTRAAVDNVFRLGPERALTGPVARGDLSTITRHLEALADAPDDVAALYRAASRHLAAIAARRTVDASTLRQVVAALEAENPPKQ
jgi:predicted short-subunit dehydrogenase-like oxidoreductase (DUF2520 family)